MILIQQIKTGLYPAKINDQIIRVTIQLSVLFKHLY